MKFNRTYRLDVEVAGGKKTSIALPYSIDFTVERKNLATSQVGTFVIYNLNEKTRELIYKDRYNTTEFRAIQFWAGYDGELSLVFNGTIFEAYSERQGVNYTTTLECQDGAFAMLNAFSNLTIGSNIRAEEILKTLTNDLALVGVSNVPIIGKYSTRFVRKSVYIGNTWNYIVQLTDGLAMIDNGQFKALNTNEAIASAEIPVITSDSGLLGVPKRSGTMIQFPMIFEPRLSVGQLVQLQSTANSMFNGTYKVVGLVHRGNISESVSKPATTEVSLWKGVEAFSLVPEVAP